MFSYFFQVVNAVDGHLWKYPLTPRSSDGWFGMLIAPFMHGGQTHLVSNLSIGVILAFLIGFTGVRPFLEVSLIAGLTSGVGIWLFGSAPTVGASGVIFGWLLYLLTRGIANRSLGQTIQGVIIFLIYGGVLYGLLPGQDGISFAGHFWGAVGGVIAALTITSDDPPTMYPGKSRKGRAGTSPNQFVPLSVAPTAYPVAPTSPKFLEPAQLQRATSLPAPWLVPPVVPIAAPPQLQFPSGARRAVTDKFADPRHGIDMFPETIQPNWLGTGYMFQPLPQQTQGFPIPHSPQIPQPVQPPIPGQPPLMGQPPQPVQSVQPPLPQQPTGYNPHVQPPAGNYPAGPAQPQQTNPYGARPAGTGPSSVNPYGAHTVGRNIPARPVVSPPVAPAAPAGPPQPPVSTPETRAYDSVDPGADTPDVTKVYGQPASPAGQQHPGAKSYPQNRTDDHGEVFPDWRV